MAYDIYDDFHWYIEHQYEFVEKYDGKCLVIRNHEVLGAYDSEEKALEAALARYPFGEFMIQPCSAGPEAYTIHNPRLSALLA
ncbi:MAG: hypothetical protein LBS30_00195 [Planctomycetota bacterium]|jgi:hypothetical protein|nr:hypothetical protein [Planctomycetota bacterium]